jgi:hypothetical protein
MKTKFIVFLVLIANVVFSQGEANIWYFGENAGLDFNSGSPVGLIPLRKVFYLRQMCCAKSPDFEL